MEMCKWAVVFYTDGKLHDDGEQRRTVVAVFRYPFQATDFIEKCLPAENRDRFTVINLDDAAFIITRQTSGKKYYFIGKYDDDTNIFWTDKAQAVRFATREEAEAVADVDCTIEKE